MNETLAALVCLIGDEGVDYWPFEFDAFSWRVRLWMIRN